MPLIAIIVCAVVFALVGGFGLTLFLLERDYLRYRESRAASGGNAGGRAANDSRDMQRVA